ncbi:MAG: desulfoferrodoxin family protein [Nanoarchaeota archaeon]
MKGMECGTCKYIALDGAPEKCPVCGSPKKVFKEKEVNTAENEGPKEKHVPVIKIVKKCGLIGEGCTDIHTKIGEVPHPMEAEHSIQFVDFYVDKKFIARMHLTPDCNPAACVHIKANSGKLAVVEFCNLHGHWIKEEKI